MIRRPEFLAFLMRTLLTLVALACCTAVAGRAEMKRNVEYGRADGQPLLLDVHVPDGPGPFPVAILVHGGGWSSGDKAGSNFPGDGADISPWFGLLDHAGFTWFSINYRLAPKYHWPDGMNDVNTAIRWVKAHAAEYKGDPNRVVLFGHSSGGHYVMVAATEPGMAKLVRGIVGFAPVTDLVADSERRGGLSQSLQNLFGLPAQLTPSARTILAAASPINHVHPGMPPILIVHGNADRTVPIAQSIAFVAKAKAAGNSAELYTRPGAPHSLVQGEKIDQTYRPVVLKWLDRVLDLPIRKSAAAAN